MLKNLKKILALILPLFFFANLISARVKIISPPELKEIFGNKTIDASLSNFGDIPYGYNIMGKVYFNPTNQDDEMACKNITGIEVDKNPEVDDSPIIMIDRGNCHFVTKVLNVQKLGGHIALIINNEETENIESIIMGDDGRGKDVHIPGILISKSDGQILKTFYRNNPDTIKLEIEFEMETDEEVNLDIYFESNDFNILKLIKNLKEYLEDTELSVNFNPRFLSFKHPFFNLNATNFLPSDFIEKNCINKGRYCVNPRGLLNKNLKGKDVIKNNLFIKCAFQLDDSSNADFFKPNFFNFIEFFYNDCLDYFDEIKKDDYFTEKCVNKALQKSGFDLNGIKECLENSFFPKGIENIDNIHAKNSLLDSDNEDKRNNYLRMIPSILINKRTYYGNLNAENLFEAICAGYKKKPEVCYDKNTSRKKSHFLIIILIIAIVIILNLLIFVLCRKYFNKKIKDGIDSKFINNKVDIVVNNYIALKDQQNKN